MKAKGIVLIALAFLAGLPEPALSLVQSPKSDETDRRPQWWFPTDLPTGKYHEFAVEVVSKGFEDDLPLERTDRGKIIISIQPAASGKPGQTMRIEAAESEKGSECWLTDFIITLLTNDPDLQVGITADSIVYNDLPILRGPLRKGDRHSAFIAIFFWGTLLSHGEIISAGPNGIEARLESWQGDKVKYKCTGRMKIESDTNGIRLIVWSLKAEHEKRTHSMTAQLTRMRIMDHWKPKAPASQPATK